MYLNQVLKYNEVTKEYEEAVMVEHYEEDFEKFVYDLKRITEIYDYSYKINIVSVRNLVDIVVHRSLIINKK